MPHSLGFFWETIILEIIYLGNDRKRAKTERSEILMSNKSDNGVGFSEKYLNHKDRAAMRSVTAAHPVYFSSYFH